MAKTAVLALESGEVFRGEAFGAEGTMLGEMVFTASPVGFQGLVSDPALEGKILLAAYPLLGNCGANELDDESRGVHVSGVVARECCARASSFSSVRSFSEYLSLGGAPGIAGVDTRKLVRILRERGNLRAVITTEEITDEAAVALARDYQPPRDLAARVSCDKLWRSRAPHHTRTVAVLDCGVKRSLLRALNELRCDAVVVPHDVSALEIRALAADALLISNGPGDPADAGEAVNTAKSLLGELPVFGVGLGFGILALAAGAKTHKLPYGAYGSRAVREIKSKRIISAPFAVTHGVERLSLEREGFTVTHEASSGGEAYGAANAALRCSGVLFNPEGSPGSLDAAGVLRDFINSTGRED